MDLKTFHISLPLASDSPCWHHSLLLQVQPSGLIDSAVEQEVPNMKANFLIKSVVYLYKISMASCLPQNQTLRVP